MKQNEKTNRKSPLSLKTLIPYILITFGLAWGILALYIFLQDSMTSLFGRLTGNHPLFFMAVYAPAIAAFIILLYKTGINGLHRFLTRLSLWRTSLPWYSFLILGIPLIFYAGAAIKGTLPVKPFPFPTFQSLVTALLLAGIKGPVEEFGWRGFALPLLQKKMAPVWAALLLGVIWGVWHLPAFMLSGTQQSGWSFLPFFLGTISISIIITALFNASKGSILLAAFMHFQLMNPIWPDAQPYDTWLLTAAAIPIIWFNRSMFFGKENAVVEVIPAKE